MGISAGLGSSALLPAGLGFRNVLINGDFRINQRNGTAIQTITAGAALAYTFDRWYAACTTANGTVRPTTGASGVLLAPGASSTPFTFGQRIEAVNSSHLAGKTVTLSANLRGISNSAVQWSLFYANTTDSFGTIASPTRTLIAQGVFSYTDTAATYTAQIGIPALATTGLELVFQQTIGSTNALSIFSVQLEENFQPTPFERRPIGVELQLCERYYYRRGGTVEADIYISGFQPANSPIIATFFHPVRMRATPSLAQRVGTWITINSASQAIVANASATSYHIFPFVNPAISNANQSSVYTRGDGTTYVEMSAEL